MAITGQCKRRRIVINADAYISGATSNVPVLVKFNSTSHADLFGTGDDKDSVWFSSDAGGNTTLYHEGVVFDSTDAHFYVKCDLSSTGDTVIYLWYGTPSITGTESKTNVWTNGRAIYHFEATAGNVIDSLGNFSSSTYSISDREETGKVGNSYKFSSSYITLSDVGITTSHTFHVWAKASSGGGYILGDTDSVNSYYLVGSTGYYRSGATYATIPFSATATNWNNYVFTRNSGTYTAYLNGGAVTPTGDSGSSNFTLKYIGRRSDGADNWDGHLDELWIFSDIKTSDWAKAVYNNVETYSTFITIDGAVTIGSSPKMIVPVWASSGTVYEENDIAFGVTYAPSVTQSEQTLVSAINTTASYTFGGGAGSYLSGFSNRIKLTLDYTKVSSTLSNFPVLLKLASSSGTGSTDLTTVFDELGANSKKIAVTTADGTTQCYVEIERWDNANELAILWAKIPSISHEADTIIYLYYDSSASDNTTYVGDTDSAVAENVWDSDYELIYHLNSESTIKDSTTNDNDGTITGTLSSVDGQNGKAVSVGSGEYITLASTITLADYTWTISYWLKENGASKCFDGVVGSDTNNHWIRHTNLTGSPQIVDAMCDSVTNNKATRGDYTADDSWHYFVVRRTASGDNVKIFRDTVELSNALETMANEDLTIKYVGQYKSGDSYFSTRWEGSINEIRISSTNRSDAWIVADYNSQNDSLIEYEIDISAPNIDLVWITGAKEATVTYAGLVQDVDVDVELINFTVNYEISEVTSTENQIYEETIEFGVTYALELTTTTVYTQSINTTATYTFLATYGRVDSEEILFEVDYSLTDLTPITVYTSYIHYDVTYALEITSTAVYLSEILFEANYGNWNVNALEVEVELIEFGVNYSLEVTSNRVYDGQILFTADYSFTVDSVSVYTQEILFTAEYSFGVSETGSSSELIEFGVTYDLEIIPITTYYASPLTFGVDYSAEVLPVILTAATISKTVEYSIHNCFDTELLDFGVTYSALVQDVDADIELIEFGVTYEVDIIEYVETITFGVDYTFNVVTQFPTTFSSWNYRKSKHIVGAATEQTDYAICLTLHYGAGTDDNDNVYLGSHGTADFADIRFGSDDTSLKYWIEEKVDSDYAIVWIKIPTIAVSGTDIYIYYGNAAASSESSGADTFLQYHGEETSSFAESTYLSCSNTKYRSKIDLIASNSNVYEFGLKSSDNNDYTRFYLLSYRSSPLPRRYDQARNSNEGSQTDSSAHSMDDGEQVWEFTIENNGSSVVYKDTHISGTTTTVGTLTENIPDESLGIYWTKTGGSGGTHTWAYLTKYISPEPYFTSTGDQEVNNEVTSTPNLVPIYVMADQEVTTNYSLTFEKIFASLITYEVDYSLYFHSAGLDIELVEFGVTYEFGVPYAKTYINIDNFKVTSIGVNKSISDATWSCEIQIDGLTAPSYYKHLTVDLPDHTSTDHTVFVGFVPHGSKEIVTANNKARVTAYDYSWYLSVQFVPDTMLITDDEPSDIVYDLLGGLLWERTTGISPYVLTPVSNWATIQKTFMWDSKTTKLKAIQEMCEYIGYIFLVKWAKIGSFYYPVAYFIPKADVDIYLNLPAAITFTYGSNDDEVVDGIKLENNQIELINCVRVRGIDTESGSYFTTTVMEDSVYYDDFPAVEYYYESSDLNTQDLVDAKALELYNLLSNPAKTYTITFLNRTDLELYQKLKFVGFSEIDTSWYRIIGISFAKSATETLVTVKLASDEDYTNSDNLTRNVNDFTDNIVKIVDSKIYDIPTISIGTITAVDGSTATVALEDGSGSVTARLLNQT